MRGARDKRELTAIESEENAAVPLRLPLAHGHHDGGNHTGLPYACVQSFGAQGWVDRGFSTASLAHRGERVRLPRGEETIPHIRMMKDEDLEAVVQVWHTAGRRAYTF